MSHNPLHQIIIFNDLHLLQYRIARYLSDNQLKEAFGKIGYIARFRQLASIDETKSQSQASKSLQQTTNTTVEANNESDTAKLPSSAQQPPSDSLPLAEPSTANLQTGASTSAEHVASSQVVQVAVVSLKDFNNFAFVFIFKRNGRISQKILNYIVCSYVNCHHCHFSC